MRLVFTLIISAAISSSLVAIMPLPYVEFTSRWIIQTVTPTHIKTQIMVHGRFTTACIESITFRMPMKPRAPPIGWMFSIELLTM